MKETREKALGRTTRPRVFLFWYSSSVADYTEQHAKSGIDTELPSIECWPNQFPGYEISVAMPEFTSICPKTGLPDFGTITVCYRPDKLCLELKSLKGYFTAYRNLGIFYENAVNRILRDIVKACQPVSIKVTGDFSTRGGMRSVIEAEYPSPSTPSSGR
ncbi:MAG: NADPH-dependent 7-cyano-7-deazaguanine reductase QueF [Acidobacteria bacterium]|nr:MAG: NADPH-dependent 7-cyano-7-deazaguanine reductase QueF [Acidobacteriota bacterium]